MFVYRVVPAFAFIVASLAQKVPWESSCVTDPSGKPMIHVENHSDKLMHFAIDCYYDVFDLYVDPDTTQSVPATFLYLDAGGNCLLNAYGNTYSATVYSEFANVAGYQWDTVFCSPNPGIEERFIARSTCELDRDGFLTLEFVNNLDHEAQYIALLCLNEYISSYDEEYDYVIPPKSTLRVQASYYNYYYYKEYPAADCTMISDTEGFEMMNYLTMDFYMTNFFEGSIYCMGRTAFDQPIVRIIPHCPPSVAGNPTVELRADVPAYALARCSNGDQAFLSVDEVSYKLDGTFRDTGTRQCCFYKKAGIDTFTVDVEVGWGEEDKEVFEYQKIHTVSCSYDDHGEARSSVELITDWYIAPNEEQSLFGNDYSGTFDLRVLDVLDRQINTAHISIGKKIRLKASDTTGTLPAFRALSCVASNGVSSYPILRAGCGDGLVFEKGEGFATVGNVVYSPYFNTFKLRGGSTLWFRCRFTVCSSDCNGSSCEVEMKGRKPRSADVIPLYEGLTHTFSLK